VAVFGPGTNTAEQQHKYLDYGVDWIVTDRPDILAMVRRERTEGSRRATASSAHETELIN